MENTPQKPIENKNSGGLNLGGFDIEKIKGILDTAKKYFIVVKDFFSDKEHEKVIITSLAVVSASILGYSIFSFIQQSSSLENQTVNLNQLEKYDIQSLKNNQVVANSVNNATTIDDLLNINNDIKNEIKRYDAHKTELQSSYSNFLRYFLVPNLNVWKEPYTNKIKLDMIGENFLEKNPFNEINLYQKRSNFFGNTEKNQVNTIDELQIDKISENEFGLYSIKLSFSFSTPSKNALLFLADKISMTSDKENIALLGEFIYYLRQQIKADKKDEISSLMNDPINKDLAGDEDKIIGKNLYQRIVEDKDTKLIDDKLINKTVKNIMVCGSEGDASCFYKFRDKYRNIAELAYTVGASNNANKTNDLKSFFKNMPPLISVTNFTFDKKISKDSLNQAISYQGSVALEIYGQNITSDDIQQISTELGKKCFGKSDALTPSSAIAAISQNSINGSGGQNGFDDNGKADLKSILDNIASTYDTEINYKKTIRLFEIYRMMNEAGYCSAL